MIGEGETTIEEDLLSLIKYFEVEETEIDLISKGWHNGKSDNFTNSYSEAFIKNINSNKAVFPASIISISKVLPREDSEFYKFLQTKYYDGTI